jgi:transposase-like protein
MPAPTVSPEIKAAALADLLDGDTPAEVAARYRLNRNTVKSWASRLDADAPGMHPDAPPYASTDAPEDLPVAVPALASSHSIGALILDLLRAKLQASQAIATAAKNPAWLDRQSAADLATLGEYLDRSAFALGDRLAGQPGGDRSDGA